MEHSGIIRNQSLNTTRPITVDITSKIIDSLKPETSTGVDCISNKLLNYVKNVLSELLTIINQILNMGGFPDLLKLSKSFQYKRKRTIPYIQITGLSHCCHPFLKILKKL